IWVSSNPPPYGVGLAVPYGAGGTFSVQLDVGPVIKEGTDCRTLSCSVVTRADHTRLTDRSQDVLVPVTFRAETPATPAPQPTASGGSTAVAPTATPSPTPTATPAAATATTVSTPPAAALSSDGLRATAGGAELSIDRSTSLASEGAAITVKGKGYRGEQGVYVALCAIAAGKAPGPCYAGTEDASGWISSNPPEALKARAKPYGADGSFELQLTVRPVIDATTDCRKVACAISTRNDDSAPGDRSQDLYIPVTFAEAQPETFVTSTPGSQAVAVAQQSPSGGGDSGSNAVLWVAVAVIVLGAVAGAGVLLARKRRAAVVTSSLIVLLVGLLLGGCAGDEAAPGGDPVDAPIVVGTAQAQVLPVTVKSADGREVQVTDTTRIVSLWGNLTELVFGVGLGESVVGRDSTATFPEASSLPLVTRGHDTSVEGVLSLNPTLVLASKDNSGPSTALDQIRNVGIPVVVVKDPESVEEIVPRIRLVAAALGVPAAGEELVKATEQRLAEAQAEIPDDAEELTVAFLYMRGTAGVYLLAGPKSGADSIIRAAGAVDAGTAMGLHQAFTPLTSEALASAAPDVILMTTSGLDSVGGVSGLLKIPGVAQTPAGQAKRVVTMEDSLLYSFGPRTPQAIEELIGALYGGLAQSPK
ncbi:MAG TPA: ABC transporter substrate-binding protein, partial [Vicinamibacterales bacterium]